MTVPSPRPLIGIPTWNDESSTYSGVQLYGMNKSYVAALHNAGALPALIPLNSDVETLRGLFNHLDGLFLAGGNDITSSFYDTDEQEQHAQPNSSTNHHLNTNPPATSPTATNSPDMARDTTELTLAHWALDAGMPLFGVCRGMQLINVACGGTLYQDLHQQRPGLTRHDYFGPHHKRDQIRHHVTFTKGTALHQIFGKQTGVNSMHHQGVKHLGMDLRIAATSTDGLPEAIESTDSRYVMGTQWHPEELAKSDARHRTLFNGFLSAASDRWRH